MSGSDLQHLASVPNLCAGSEGVLKDLLPQEAGETSVPTKVRVNAIALTTLPFPASSMSWPFSIPFADPAGVLVDPRGLAPFQAVLLERSW